MNGHVREGPCVSFYLRFNAILLILSFVDFRVVFACTLDAAIMLYVICIHTRRDHRADREALQQDRRPGRVGVSFAGWIARARPPPVWNPVRNTALLSWHYACKHETRWLCESIESFSHLSIL